MSDGTFYLMNAGTAEVFGGGMTPPPRVAVSRYVQGRAVYRCEDDTSNLWGFRLVEAFEVDEHGERVAIEEEGAPC